MLYYCLLTPLLLLLVFSILSFRSYLRKRSPDVLIFTVLLMTTIFWGIALITFTSTLDRNISIISAKMVWIIASIMVTNFAVFGMTFPQFIIIKKKLLLVITSLYGFDFIFAIFALFSDLVIKGTDLNKKKMLYGYLYFVVVIYIVCLIILTIYILNKQIKKANQKHIGQVKFISYGFTCTGVLAAITNIILPNIIGSSRYSTFGVLATLPAVISIAIAILKYRLFDIRVLFGRIFYYILIGSVFMMAYYFIYFLDIVSFGGSKQLGAILTGPINAIIFAIFFVKLNDFLRKEVRSRIINPGYDPLEVTDQLSRSVASTLSIRDISQMTIETFTKTLRPSYVSIIVFPENKDLNNLVFDSPEKEKQIDKRMLQLLDAIWTKAGKQSIILDELDFEMPKRLEMVENEVAQVAKYMQESDIKLIVPLIHERKNSGMIILGKKEADSPYSMQDIQFVQGVASTLELALTRSLYFLEVEDLNINLQKRVDAATADLKQKNIELTDAMAKLQEVRRRERDMVDVMGHELRTPITIVRNALLFLQSKLQAGGVVERPKLVEYVDKAVESSRREINLVETLLSATKIDANRIQLNLTKIDMLDVINDSLDGLKPSADEKALEIKYVKPTGKEFWGYADRTRTQEIMDNFLSNAIKYTQKGFVEITIGQTDKETFISIKDSGIGIHKDDIANLGKKFYRAKQYTGTNGDVNVVRPGGTGLGLYVSFNLIKMMGGRVQIQSEPGKGSTFTMFIPIYTGQPDKHTDQTFD